MVIEYENTPDDVLALNTYYNQFSPRMRRRIAANRIVHSSFIVIIGMFVFYFLSINKRVTIELLVIGLVCGLLFFAVYPLITKANIRSITKRYIRDGRYKGMLGKHRISLTEEGLMNTSVLGETKFFWN